MTDERDMTDETSAHVNGEPKRETRRDLVVAKRNMIAGMSEAIAQVLPKHLTLERAVRLYQTCISKSPKLAQCTNESIATAIITTSEFGLEPNTPLGECYLIPYGDQCTFQIGYQGLIKLAYQSGRVQSVYAEAVYEKDTFEIRLGLNRDIMHKMALGERGAVIGYYGVITLMAGDPLWAYMSVADLDVFARTYSQAVKGRQSTPWTDSPLSREMMCKKTVIIRAAKYAPKSIEDQFTKALYIDDDVSFDSRAPRDVTPKAKQLVQSEAGPVRLSPPMAPCVPIPDADGRPVYRQGILAPECGEVSAQQEPERRRGRPPGSKNKPKEEMTTESAERPLTQEAPEDSLKTLVAFLTRKRIEPDDWDAWYASAFPHSDHDIMRATPYEVKVVLAAAREHWGE